MSDPMWIFAAGFLLGIIAAFVLAAKTCESITEKRIKAGYFDHKGNAYRIQEVAR